jgi:hypothetical protein
VDNLYFTQAVNNLAMMQDNPASLPYFSIPTQGTNTLLRSVQATYTPGWDFITAAGYYFSRWVFDKETAAIQGTNQNSEAWQMLPTTNPDKINLLKCAYQRTLGICTAECDKALSDFYGIWDTHFNYKAAFHNGWYGVGKRKDVPKGACYVGRCGKTYVWVMPENMEDLSKFTLAVLDIVTAAPTTFIWKDPKALAELAGLYNKSRISPEAMTPLEQILLNQLQRSAVLQPRAIPVIPFPAPPSP